MPTAIDLLLEWLPAAINLVATWTGWVNKGVETLQQATELTPEQEAKRDAIIAARQASPAWQQDPPEATPGA